ncbi:hypothetical protein OEZ86_013742 [Tetradesmus obliquus]|nr:hypothetical protein OEZ86_013742 [Tetradesmus obliquus]
MASYRGQDLKHPAYNALKEVFGFEGFRGVQEDAVKAALEGRDAFVLMPTGGGKSLCYALPAVVRGGLVVVVSPLIALMQDQVAALQARGIAADFLSSSRSSTERKALLARLDGAAAAAAAAAGSGAGGAGRRLALLYVTPELLATDGFRQQLLRLHAAKSLQMLAVDEAHCISSWGHDFRPAYRQLAQLRQQLSGLPCMALTATATHQVQQDILSSLRMRNPALLVTSFNRPNIHYTVTLLDVQQPPAAAAAAAAAAAGSSNGPSAKAAGLGLGHGEADGIDALEEPDDDVDLAGYSHLLPLLKSAGGSQKPKQHQAAAAAAAAAAGGEVKRAWPGPVAIVYVLKRSTVDVLVRRLSAEGLAAAGYHAALPDALRAAVLERWRDGKLQVVVATVAFGMGVDKADIELVVHFNLPRSVESFYQESGRAGRAGQPARSVLFYSTRDRRRMDYILQKDADSKAARKRKKAAAKAAAASTTAAAATAAAAEPVDPQVAAAALRAFGAVVDLCTQPGCRRVKLLRHFGEEYKPQQQQQQQQRSSGSSNHTNAAAAAAGMRCCNYCDSASSVEAAQQQLKEAEVEMLQQRWRGGRGGWQQGGGKRQRLDDGWMDGGGSGSEDEDDSGAGGSEDDDVELDPESAAAAAAVAKAAAAARASGKAAAAGGAGSDAFLSAMLRAEQRHERQQQQQQAGGGYFVEKRAPPGGLTDSIRAGRRAKLAELLAATTAAAAGATRRFDRQHRSQQASQAR